MVVVGALERLSKDRVVVVHNMALIRILLLCHSELLGVVCHSAVTRAHRDVLLWLPLLISSTVRVVTEERRRLVPTLLTLAEDQLVVVLIHLGDVVAQEVTVADGRGSGSSISHHVRTTWH